MRSYSLTSVTNVFNILGNHGISRGIHGLE